MEGKVYAGPFSGDGHVDQSAQLARIEKGGGGTTTATRHVLPE